jgi:hypothetical protein
VCESCCQQRPLFVGFGLTGGSPQHGSVWRFEGRQGTPAGNLMCRAIANGDHACTYAELESARGRGELASFIRDNAGQTIWVHRTGATVNVNGRNAPPAAGSRCGDWTYETNHIFDGEFATAAGGTLNYSFDPDGGSKGNLACGGAQRRIACCRAACP